VSGGIVGQAVNAVLVPPQAERFASLVGADPGRLVLNVSGWNKLVLMDSERVLRLRHALRLLADPGDPAVVGTLEEHLAVL
jgi:hypothetical protein